MTEAQLVTQAEQALSAMCANVEREYELTPGGLRVDLKGELPNGHFVLVETKAFSDNLTPFVDAIMQAASYADSIRYPVFIGPISGSRSSVAIGKMESAISALHLVAGRLNVGFLCLAEHNGHASLVLRGQALASSISGIHSEFDRHFGYIQRVGSRRLKS